jgi:hypothetical protein
MSKLVIFDCSIDEIRPSAVAPAVYSPLLVFSVGNQGLYSSIFLSVTQKKKDYFFIHTL